MHFNVDMIMIYQFIPVIRRTKITMWIYWRWCTWGPYTFQHCHRTFIPTLCIQIGEGNFFI